MRLLLVSKHKAFDIEEMVVLLSLYTLAAAYFWIMLDLPVPHCPFYAFTGLPCLTCGITRAAHALAEGSFQQAFLLNPLFVISAASLAFFDIYSVAVILGRSRRIRVSTETKRGENMIRAAIVCLVLFNWMYLIASDNGHSPLLSAFLLP